MRSLFYGLILASAGLIAFGYWGLETVAGRHAYDEMAGIVPFGAAVLGVIAMIAAACVVVYATRRR